MAKLERRLPANAPGPFYVDDTCIDCDLCRQIAPEVFAARGDTSVVHRQPTRPATTLRAEMALVTCPTSSIGASPKRNLDAAIHAYPERVTEGVYFCGFASEASYGAASYLVTRPRGNVLVDSPRYHPQLARRIAELGGVRFHLLTHQDDVADHQRFHERFGTERIMHDADASFTVEQRLHGAQDVALDDDLVVVPTPGHTRGHVVLSYRDEVLFSGDHLWGDPDTGELAAGRGVCWYSWAEQRRSMARLRDVRFEWVLPGHGPRLHAPHPHMQQKLERLLARM